MTRYGFFIDLSRCIGCNGCLIACKQWHDIEPGPVKWLRVFQWETGAFPNIELHHLPMMCLHCENPVCVSACPNHAIEKKDPYGAVTVDPEKCDGKRKCWQACPYGAPQFSGDDGKTKMSKCNMCIDRLDEGLKPICVLSCSMRALEFGPMEELKKKYGESKWHPTSSQTTRPAVIFKPKDPKKEIVPYDHGRALALWRKRNSEEGQALPDVFENENDITDVDNNIYLRNKLVLKTSCTKDLMNFTTDDE